ncbi:hypothetical protein SAMN05216197_104151 [Pseudomonas graminis]|uniref:Lipoprotein n=1 Tax=Pseudomonas graminis TaxID=158627 RepID=A0A1I0ASC7_9PSED|nr:hypothetical protein SAMN05216197_104151 [Pseudomonas graminis]
MDKRLSRTRATTLLITATVLVCVSGCTTKATTGASLVDYTSVSASSPPDKLTGLWVGPHAGGTFFVEIFEDGDLRTCLSAPPYYRAMDGKYADEALYLEDGTRIEFQPAGAQQITIYSPPGRPVTTLERGAPGLSASECQGGADDVQRKLSHWAAQ